MSLTKKDRKIRSDSGKGFPIPEREHESDRGTTFVQAIAEALHREFDDTHSAVKRVAALTGANERAVKNWFSAKNGPNGSFLVELMRTSDQVLESVLLRAGRNDLITAKKLADVRHQLGEMLTLIDRIQGGEE